MSEVTFLEVGLFSRRKLARRCDATATMEIRSEWKPADGWSFEETRDEKWDDGREEREKKTRVPRSTLLLSLISRRGVYDAN